MDWHYQDPKTGERRGPTSAEVMADKFRQGELDGDTLVWRDGLASWQLASQVPELAADARRSAAAVAMPATGAIGYFSPRGDTPARVQQNLRKYAAPTGPVGDWPLNDEHVAQLSRAVVLRKRILGAYGLIRLVAALQLIVGAIFLAIGGFAIAGLSGGRARATAWEMLAPGIVFTALAILAFICANAAWYCRAWGSLVMAILTTIGLIIQLVGVAMTGTAVSQAGAAGAFAVMIVGNLIGLAISAAFAYVYWRGWASTGPYLNTPVWCQEALAVADRAR